MAYICPDCGARHETGGTCEDKFNADQLRELEKPAYYAVHHLSVPCYMLQHNRYSREGWLEVRQLLARFLDGLSREEARREWGNKRKTFSITRGPKLEGVESIRWTMTIADVRVDSAEAYCADVRAWAESIIRDSEPLVRKAAAE